MLTNLDSIPVPHVPHPAEVRSPESRSGETKAVDHRQQQNYSTATSAMPNIVVDWPRGQRVYAVVRRGVEIVLALGLLAVLGPVMLLAALAVKLTSRGPAFYTQTRTGKNGEPFTIFKIRTMVDKCESLTGPRWTIPGDPRITPVGWFLRRSHIDELPQILNVLRGDMSLIGPRPERPEFVDELRDVFPDYTHRHAVLPGITGLAQVQLAPDTEVENVGRKLKYDLYYVEKLSPWLDVRISVATVLHMFGMSFETVQRLRLVPGPALVEPDYVPAAESDSDAEIRDEATDGEPVPAGRSKKHAA